LQALLPERVGSVLSVKNLSQDLSVAFETADHFLQILERLYYCFRIQPYGLPKLKTAKKEKKLYLWDWSLCTRESSILENFVASHLLKYCHFQEDTEGSRMELCFIRDAYGREIDFVVVCDKKPLFAVECKSGEENLSANIKYFANRSHIPRFYQVHLGKTDIQVADFRTRILPFTTLAKDLKL
jgi:predicted AAA+ superfamily ATPase